MTDSGKPPLSYSTDVVVQVCSCKSKGKHDCSLADAPHASLVLVLLFTLYNLFCKCHNSCWVIVSLYVNLCCQNIRSNKRGSFFATSALLSATPVNFSINGALHCSGFDWASIGLRNNYIGCRIPIEMTSKEVLLYPMIFAIFLFHLYCAGKFALPNCWKWSALKLKLKIENIVM